MPSLDELPPNRWPGLAGWLAGGLWGALGGGRSSRARQKMAGEWAVIVC